MWTLLIKESKDFFCKSSLLCNNKRSSNELSYSISVTNFAPSSERISKLTIDCLGRSGPIRTWSGTLLSTAMSRTSGCLQVFSGSQTYSCTTGAEPVNDLSTGQTYLRPWVWVSWGGILCGRDSMEISCAEVFVISPAAQYAQQRSSLVLRISKNCTQHAFFGQTISCWTILGLFSSRSQVA